MLRILLVTDTPKPMAALRETLSRQGYDMLDGVSGADALQRSVEKQRPDVVIIDTESPSRDTLEQLAVMHATAPRPVVMFSTDTDQQRIRKAIDAGVSTYLAEGLAPEKLAPILDVALAHFAREVALRKRLNEAESALADRKVIDRVKRLLMDQRRLSEQDAYAFLRRHAMDHGMKLAHAARQIMSLPDLPG